MIRLFDEIEKHNTREGEVIACLSPRSHLSIALRCVMTIQRTNGACHHTNITYMWMFVCLDISPSVTHAETTERIFMKLGIQAGYELTLVIGYFLSHGNTSKALAEASKNIWKTTLSLCNSQVEPGPNINLPTDIPYLPIHIVFNSWSKQSFVCPSSSGSGCTVFVNTIVT